MNQSLFESIEKLVEIKWPTVEAILKARGFNYEADIIAKIVHGYEASRAVSFVDGAFVEIASNVEKLAAIKWPTVEAILKARGFNYEADIVAQIVQP